MQAHRSFQLVVVLPLKVPHFIAYRASRAAPSVALLASSVQFSRCRIESRSAGVQSADRCGV